MDRNRRIRSRGNSVLEFTLVGIPLVCVLISTFEMCRGMWYYHTLAYAVKEGVRYAVVHGQNCSQPPNSCAATISTIARVIRGSEVGLAADSLTLTFTDATGSVTTCSMSDCIANYDVSIWPPATANAPGQKVTISGTYPFRPAILMFWPGAGKPMGPPKPITFAASSRESIQY